MSNTPDQPSVYSRILKRLALPGAAIVAGLTFTPELYKCGINYVGVTDIALLFKTMPDAWGDTAAPHPVAKAPELLTEEVCTSCHQANPNESAARATITTRFRMKR